MVDVIPPIELSPIPILQDQKAVAQVVAQMKSPMKLKQGIPYKELDNFVDLLRGFQELDMDLLIPITGFKGSGKTTNGMDIASKYLEKYGTEPFDPERHIAYDNFDVQNLIQHLPPYSPLLCDEAVRFAMGEDWQKGESKELKKKVTQIRTKHLIILFCIPEFWWLDKKYREDLTVFWIHCFCRGYSLVFTPDLRLGVEDHWHRKEFQKGVTRSINIFTPINEILPYYRKHPCYWSDLSFYKINERIYSKYLRIRDQKALEPSQSLSRFELIKLILWKLKKQFGFSDEKLAVYLKNPINNSFPFSNQNTTGQLINDWTREMENSFGQCNIDFPAPKISQDKAKKITALLNPISSDKPLNTEIDINVNSDNGGGQRNSD